MVPDQERPTRAPERRRGRPKGGGMSAPEAREHLLDAAERCFERYGIEKTTVEDVATEAGLSRGMVYRHFDGRDDLLTGVVARITDRYTSAIAAQLDPATSLSAFILDTMVSLVVAARSDPALAQLFTTGGLDLAGTSVARSEAVKQRARTFVHQLLDRVAPAQLAELRPDLDLDAVADHLVFVGLALILGIGPDADDPQALRRYLEAFLLPALIADGAPDR